MQAQPQEDFVRALMQNANLQEYLRQEIKKGVQEGVQAEARRIVRDEYRRGTLERRAPNGDCHTVSEVAEMRGCSEKTIRRDMQEGILWAEFPMAKKKFHPEDVRRYLKGLRGRARRPKLPGTPGKARKA